MGSVAPPAKTREIHNHHQDSTVWNDFPFRSDDIIIATYSKSGTTWMQQIVAQLIHSGNGSVSPADLSPWVDMRILPREATIKQLEDQKDRRFMKTHLPADAMVWMQGVKYIYIGRDARDVMWSLHHHFTIATPLFWSMVNDTPGRVGPPMAKPKEDPRELFIDLVEDDTRSTIPWPFWSHMRSWWAVRDQPNVLFVHFADLKKNLDGEMKRIAEFLGTADMSDAQWKAAVEHSTFAWMKANAHNHGPDMMEQAFSGGRANFINKGTNGRWTDSLSEEDNKRFKKKAREELGDACAEWLEKGGHV